jgi:hypothetical protein
MALIIVVGCCENVNGCESLSANGMTAGLLLFLLLEKFLSRDWKVESAAVPTSAVSNRF